MTETLHNITVGSAIMSTQQLFDLPVGSVVGHEDTAGWIKTGEDEWTSGTTVWQSAMLRHDDGYFTITSVGGQPEQMLVQPGAVVEGMTISTLEEGPKWYVIDVTDDEAFCISTGDILPPARTVTLSSNNEWHVWPQPGNHEWLRAIGRDLFDERTQRRSLANQVSSQRNEFEQWKDRLNDAANEFADRKDLCGDYDEFMEGQGLRSRSQDYVVVVYVGGTITKTVTAKNADKASDEALRDISLSEGDTHTLYSEDFVVRTVNVENVDVD